MLFNSFRLSFCTSKKGFLRELQKKAFSSRPTYSTKFRNGIEVILVPVLEDNYSYLVFNRNRGSGVVIDAQDPETLINIAKKQNISLKSILTTHHHWDHAGGNKFFKDLSIPSFRIYGSDSRVDCLTDFVQQDDLIQVENLQFKVHETPCHTRKHILFELQENGETLALFTGDTLFVGGCGRFFEGTPEQMYHALYNVIGNFPGSTPFFCGHEYTLSNLKFALSVEPNNGHLKNKYEWSVSQRRKNLPTIPSTIEEEKSYNPFLRVHLPSIAKALNAEGSSPIEVMKLLRAKKDSF